MYEVRQSGIHGQGLFAIRPIRAGTLIGRVQTRPAIEDGPFVLWLDDGVAVEVVNELRYINHAAEPTAVYYDTGEVVALRDIAPDEEITHNYHGDGGVHDFDALP